MKTYGDKLTGNLVEDFALFVGAAPISKLREKTWKKW